MSEKPPKHPDEDIAAKRVEYFEAWCVVCKKLTQHSVEEDEGRSSCPCRVCESRRYVAQATSPEKLAYRDEIMVKLCISQNKRDVLRYVDEIQTRLYKKAPS